MLGNLHMNPQSCQHPLAGSDLIPAGRPWSHTATIVEIAKYRSSQRHAVQGVRKLLLTETDSAGGVFMCFFIYLVGRTHVDLRWVMRSESCNP